MKKACKKQQIKESIFPKKVLIIVGLSVVILSFAALVMYQLDYFRYIILILEAVILFLLRNKLFYALRQMRKGKENER